MKRAPIPLFLYHVAHSQNANSIAAIGLLAVPDYILMPDDRPGVNFVADQDYLPWPDRPSDVWFKVDTARLDPVKFINFGSGWWRYLDNVPAVEIAR